MMCLDVARLIFESRYSWYILFDIYLCLKQLLLSLLSIIKHQHNPKQYTNVKQHCFYLFFDNKQTKTNKRSIIYNYHKGIINSAVFEHNTPYELFI